MKKEEKISKNTTVQFLIFTAENGNPKIEVRIEGEMVWLTQKLMAELFDVDVRTISEHLQNIFKSEELKEDSVVRIFRITAGDGKEYDTQHYNLDDERLKQGKKLFSVDYFKELSLTLIGK